LPERIAFLQAALGDAAQFAESVDLLSRASH
jgi:hypothetical protein